jgi:hypothetical protein
MQVMSFPTERGSISAITYGDYEFVNPIEKTCEIRVDISVQMALKGIKHPRYPQSSDPKVNFEHGQEEGLRQFKEHYDEVMNLDVPEELFKLLSLNKKKRQQAEIAKIAASDGLTSSVLQAFIYRAFLDHGYTYSMYTGEKLPSGLNAEEFPDGAMVKEDGSTRIWGDTSLSNGQIKNGILQRSVVAARILDKGPLWHCFIYTMNGVKGKEVGQGPHIHYLSNTWGHERSAVVAQVKAGDYSLNTGNHISYLHE